MRDPGDTRFYVFCSDRPRNGKTLLCRLFCGSVPDVETGSFRVLDTDYPHGVIAGMFPGNSEIIDFTRTTGQVHLFDTVLEGQNRYTLVDLQSGLLERFFTAYDDIGFDAEAHERGLHVVVYYMLDKTMRSLERALGVRETLEHGQFFLVENEAIGKPDLRAAEGAVQQMLAQTRILRFPALSPALIGLLEDPSFSLFQFMAGHNQMATEETRLELWQLLEFLYQQRSPDEEGVTHFL